MNKWVLVLACVLLFFSTAQAEENVSISEPEIVELKSLMLIGMTYFGSPDNGAFGKAWDRFIPQIRSIENRASDIGYGVQIYPPDARETGQWSYLTAVAVTDLESVPIRLFGKQLPAATYAVFEVIGGTKNIGPTFRYIYNEWLPNSEYRAAYPYNFERYEGGEVAIYIPVRPR